jgi:disulfide oxidoreductase YuzD
MRVCVVCTVDDGPDGETEGLQEEDWVTAILKRVNQEFNTYFIDHVSKRDKITISTVAQKMVQDS